jgi:anti-sigma factor RsiW
MSSLLEQLENNEAILLMYLAGELPEADRLEVEEMLASDAGLRATLAELKSLHDRVGGVLARADAAQILSRRESAVRQVSRALSQNVQNKSLGVIHYAPGPRRRLPIAWLAYPIAAAALLVIGMMIYSGNHPLNLSPKTQPPQPPQFVMGPPGPPPPEILHASLEDSLSKLETEVLSLHTPETDFFDSGEADR